MSNKKVTMYLILGMLVGLFFINPTLDYFGIIPLEDVLTSLFGENNPLVLLLCFVFNVLVLMIIYKVNSKKKNESA